MKCNAVLHEIVIGVTKEDENEQDCDHPISKNDVKSNSNTDP